jgi:hypothetical protein
MDVCYCCHALKRKAFTKLLPSNGYPPYNIHLEVLGNHNKLRITDLYEDNRSQDRLNMHHKANNCIGIMQRHYVIVNPSLTATAVQYTKTCAS